jgi:ubiquitin-conjugating enzyme (huntingtin interacting protein 2)
MKFETKVWHPNVSSETGAIGLDILRNEWSPAWTSRTALIALQALLSAPDPDIPQDAVVANQYKHDIWEFYGKARAWVKEYAFSNPEELKVKYLMEMGYDEAKCRVALEKSGGDVAAAAHYLFSM